MLGRNCQARVQAMARSTLNQSLEVAQLKDDDGGGIVSNNIDEIQFVF